MLPFVLQVHFLNFVIFVLFQILVILMIHHIHTTKKMPALLQPALCW